MPKPVENDIPLLADLARVRYIQERLSSDLDALASILGRVERALAAPARKRAAREPYPTYLGPGFNGHE